MRSARVSRWEEGSCLGLRPLVVGRCLDTAYDCVSVVVGSLASGVWCLLLLCGATAAGCAAAGFCNFVCVTNRRPTKDREQE